MKIDLNKSSRKSNVIPKIHHKIENSLVKEAESPENPVSANPESGIDLYLENIKTSQRMVIDQSKNRNIAGSGHGNKAHLNSSAQNTFNTKKSFKSVYISKK
jgi:hypothetical protein